VQIGLLSKCFPLPAKFVDDYGRRKTGGRRTQQQCAPTIAASTSYKSPHVKGLQFSRNFLFFPGKRNGNTPNDTRAFPVKMVDSVIAPNWGNTGCKPYPLPICEKARKKLSVIFNYSKKICLKMNYLHANLHCPYHRADVNLMLIFKNCILIEMYFRYHVKII